MRPAALDAVLADLRQHAASHRASLTEFVAIPSVSTDPSHAADVRRAAEWVAGRLERTGAMDVKVVETPGHPAVVAEWNGAPGAPTVTVYGHADVQPPDPWEAWASPPFTLSERDGRWYARGISDDKGSALIPLLVAEAFFRHGDPPVNLRFLIETEEEIGSPHLGDVVRRHADRLACDMVLSADGGMWRADVPTITTSTRGMVGLEVRVDGPTQDLHSGRHGGAVQNPLHALAALVAGLHEDGRVAVPGFYDGVVPLSPERATRLGTLPHDDDRYADAVGVPALHGEPGFGTLARQWHRPTLEVNGIGGGYQGAGTKTIVPASGFAKLTARLVPDQDPDRVARAIENHLQARAGEGVRVSVQRSGPGAPAYAVRADHPGLSIAREVLETVFGRPAETVGMGGSVPIVTTFRDVLGADTLFFSFSTADENIHAPNEFYRPERFELGLEAWARLWHRLAESPSSTSP